MNPPNHMKLVQLLIEGGAEPFHDPGGETYLRLPVQGHVETFRIGSREFKGLLTRTAAMRLGTAGDGVVGPATALLEGFALAGPEREVFLRVGEKDGLEYLDLCDPAWRAVEIGPGYWRIVPTPPIDFIRSPGMSALPDPGPEGSVDGLSALLNLSDGEDLKLIVGALLGFLQPRGPRPGLHLMGERGSGKSDAARILKGLVDPNRSALRREPLDAGDLAVAAHNSWVLAYDNIRSIRGWLSDGLCVLSTGGGLAKRRLFTDADEVVLDAVRPFILTSIKSVVTEGDLADRTIPIVLPTIAAPDRREERELLAAFDRARPGILGGLLDARAASLAAEGSASRPTQLPRMAEWAAQVIAAEPALGWERGSFEALLSERREDADVDLISGSLVGAAVLEIAREGFTGTTEGLLGELRRMAPETMLRRDAPATPRGLSNTLATLAPGLRASGVEYVAARPVGHDRRRILSIHMATTAEDGPGATVLPLSSKSGKGSALDEVVRALRACGLGEQSEPKSAATLAFKKSGGNARVAAEALNRIGVSPPEGDSWTADSLQEVI